jgi:hypothetical protein
MREGFAGFISVLAAAATPAAVFAAFVFADASYSPIREAFAAFFMAFIFAFCHATLLGLPTALALVHRRAFGPFPMLLAGACVGLLPTAVLFFPYNNSGWLTYLQLTSSAAGLGALGGLVFYFTHHAMSPNSSFKPNPPRHAIAPDKSALISASDTTPGGSA